MKSAFVFPGQGSQSVGMCRELYDNFAEVRSLYEEASSVLGYDLAELTFNGPAEELNRTFRTQPALLTAGIAAFTVLSLKGIKPDVVAGHSLGEYTAVTAAGVIPFNVAVGLTEKRGTFMQEAVPEGRGLMAAVLGLDRDRIEDVCRRVSSGYAAPANYNCSGQIVIAGEKEAVEEAIKLCKEAGAKRAVALAVSVPSHCRLMSPASERLSDLLDAASLEAPKVPVVNNADALYLTHPVEIKRSLVRQLNNPLLWEDSVRKMTSEGVGTFVEVGPGKVLSGLIKRIAPEAQICNVEDMKSLEDTLGVLK